MRLQTPAMLAASLLLCACAEREEVPGNAATLNEMAAVAPDNGATTDPGMPGNEAVPPGEPSAPQQPGNGTEAPEPTRGVTLAVSPAATSAGSTMTLTLHNGSPERIGYNLCTSAIETSAGGTVNTDRVCTMELRTLSPGARENYRYELPADLADGTYRFVTQVEWMETGRRSAIRSTIFRVR